MPNLATWIRPKDAKAFRTIFAKHPEIKVWNARSRNVPLDQMDGLLLTGGSDISPEFLRQKIVDPSVIDKDVEPERDRWEFKAVQEALSRGIADLRDLQRASTIQRRSWRHIEARYQRPQFAGTTAAGHSTTAPFAASVTPLFKSEQRASPGHRAAGR